MNEKTPLFGKTLAELESLAQEHKLPRFTAKQIADWLYKKDVTSIPDMTNLSTRLRDQLAERYEFGIAAPDDILTSSDGTRKYLFPTAHGRSIETAMIPMNKRRTVCISSQVGCKMGC